MDTEPNLNTVIDLPPEYLHYQDEGCEIGESCLNCRLPICIYDEPRGRQHWLKKQRDRELLRLFKKGKRVKELAKMFHISQRTVQRVLKKSISSPDYYQRETEGQDE